MVTPLAVVGDVHSVLALGVGLDDGAVGVEDRLVEELAGLLGPDPQPRLVDGVHQGEDVGLGGEAAAEVACGRGIGEPLGSEGIEIDLIVASSLDVFDPLAASEEIEGDVEHMVGFVIGQMAFEEMEGPVDLLVELDLLNHEEDGPDAAGGESPSATSGFIVDIGRGDHGYRPLGPGVLARRSLMRRRPSWKDLFLRAAHFFGE